MPKIDDPLLGRREVRYGSETERIELSMLLRLRGLRLTISRLEVEKEALEFDLEDLRTRAERLTGAIQLRQHENVAKCSFCAEQISARARVCRTCLRVQPPYFDEVAKQDRRITEQLTSFASDVKASPQNPAECSFCLHTLSPDSLICPACMRFRRDRIDTIVKYDLAAIHAGQRENKGSETCDFALKTSEV